MKLNIEVTSETTPFEFSVLSDLFRKLSGANTVPAGAIEPPKLIVPAATVEEPVVITEPTPAIENTEGAVAETKPVVTRRRRTRAEIEADAAAEEAAKVAEALFAAFPE